MKSIHYFSFSCPPSSFDVLQCSYFCLGLAWLAFDSSLVGADWYGRSWQQERIENMTACEESLYFHDSRTKRDFATLSYYELDSSALVVAWSLKSSSCKAVGRSRFLHQHHRPWKCEFFCCCSSKIETCLVRSEVRTEFCFRVSQRCRHWAWLCSSKLLFCFVTELHLKYFCSLFATRFWTSLV